MPVFRSILVPIDGSDASNVACELAVKLAADEGASVIFLNVVESDKVIASIMPGQGIADPTPAIAALRAGGTEILRDAVGTAASANVKATSELLEGDSIETILG